MECNKNKELAIIVSRQPFWLTLRLSRLVANPLESPCGDQADNQEVVTAETGGVLPSFSVLVGPLERDIVHRPFIRLLAPDAGAHGAVADFVDRLAVGFTSRRLIFLCLVFHDVLLVYCF